MIAAPFTVFVPSVTEMVPPAAKATVSGCVTEEKSRVSLSPPLGSVTVSVPHPSTKEKVSSSTVPSNVSAPAPPITRSMWAVPFAPVAVPAARFTAMAPVYAE